MPTMIPAWTMAPSMCVQPATHPRHPRTKTLLTIGHIHVFITGLNRLLSLRSHLSRALDHRPTQTSIVILKRNHSPNHSLSRSPNRSPNHRIHNRNRDHTHRLPLQLLNLARRGLRQRARKLGARDRRNSGKNGRRNQRRIGNPENTPGGTVGRHGVPRARVPKSQKVDIVAKVGNHGIRVGALPHSVIGIKVGDRHVLPVLPSQMAVGVVGAMVIGMDVAFFKLVRTKTKATKTGLRRSGRLLQRNGSRVFSLLHPLRRSFQMRLPRIARPGKHYSLPTTRHF